MSQSLMKLGVRVVIVMIALYFIVFSGVFAIVRLHDTINAIGVRIPERLLRYPSQFFLWGLIAMSCYFVIT